MTTTHPTGRHHRPARRSWRGFIGSTLAITLLGCHAATGGDTVDVANRSGQQVTSPTGAHLASLRTDGDASMLAVVVTDADGQEVFRSEAGYSTRHGVAIAWQHDGEVLWALSSDLGTSYVAPSDDGPWRQTWLTPETRDDVPPEIDALR